MMTTATVRVPATTANLGAGFDCIGAALSLYNEFAFTPIDTESLVIAVRGLEAARVNTDASNLAYQAFVKLYSRIDRSPPVIQLEIKLGVPLARGLGSSATAIVGGLLGANALAGNPLSLADIMQLAIEMEGHPDNVVPALIGGCRLAATAASGWAIADIPWHDSVVPVVAIPDFELSTAEARSVLPTDYSRADAIFNTAHLGLMVRGLETGNPEWLSAALADRLHQPYRQQLIPGYTDVERAVVAAGGYGMVISGAGPTLLALTTAERADAVATAMTDAWATHNIQAQAQPLPVDMQGAVCS
ncbi:homoserine kinase [Chamaesiphon minutus]|uniref:Homoserine kinase n=1 Tax=Chamaesiphon minutus (strain ATCC 27169 / PCC 6605) TaxID=1173020 RepID=K9UCH5_CHAP6|nr:homoserine kinase [Chamaesiphon minutus]AFY91914.1 homoserine kinase [Chamaesiphon minutus PCC 6605]